MLKSDSINSDDTIQEATVSRKKIQKQVGFTLMELMIVVAIVGILAAISVPSYAEYIRRSDRTQAMTALLRASNWLEQQFTVNNTYLVNGTRPILPPELARSPESGNIRYSLKVTASSDSAFTLQAAPRLGDRCGTYVLDQSGQRGLIGANVNLVATCWGGG
ncbi:type IV pilin protein [Glaciimonas sp. Cout2]|nr:type IV pilin protein [Glaciimonas sp. Cout2]MEB0011011.1 type IV pilin protein [Glaciimonas sp. Cout2]